MPRSGRGQAAEIIDTRGAQGTGGEVEGTDDRRGGALPGGQTAGGYRVVGEGVGDGSPAVPQTGPPQPGTDPEQPGAPAPGAEEVCRCRAALPRGAGHKAPAVPRAGPPRTGSEP